MTTDHGEEQESAQSQPVAEHACEQAATEGAEPAAAWDDDLDAEYIGGIGCYNCSGGWNHTCCDDLCRNCNEAEDCEDGGRPCKLCNPDGEGGSW